MHLLREDELVLIGATEDDWRRPVVSSSGCSSTSLSDDMKAEISKARKELRKSLLPTKRQSGGSSTSRAAEAKDEAAQNTPRPGLQTSGPQVPEPAPSQSQTSQPAPVPASNSSSPPPRKQIRFYNRDTSYYSFCNIASYPVIHDGETYPTAEHLFHALKVRS